jgi:hypothetical protein
LFQYNEQMPKWTITLSGGEWGTVKYGIVEYLRKHPKTRTATAILGLVWVVGWIASTAGFKPHLVWFPTVSAIFVAPTLLWLAVVSGPNFKLVFGPAETPKAPSTGPPLIVGPLDAQNFGIESLNAYLLATESYGKKSFRWSMLCLIGGIVSASTRFWPSSYRPGPEQSDLIWLITAGLFLISSLMLVRSMMMSGRAMKLHDQLLELQKTITAMKFIEKVGTEDASIEPAVILEKLLGSTKTSD